MADPLIVACPEAVWTKIGTAVTTGFVRKPLSEGAYKFYWTYRDTGEAPPDNSDITDGDNAQILFAESNNEELSFPTPADVYIQVKDSDGNTDTSSKVSVALP